MNRKYIKPVSVKYILGQYILMDTSLDGSSILHDMNTQTDKPGPGIGDDEEHDGDDDLEG